MAVNTRANDDLCAAIIRGLTEGNRPLLEELTRGASRNHDLRGVVEQTAGKVHDLDTEVRLLKVAIVGLMGGGDGSSGAVPALQKDVKALGMDVHTIKGDVRELRDSQDRTEESISKILENQNNLKALADQVSGGAKASKAVIVTCFTVASSAVAAVVWLLTHTVTVK